MSSQATESERAPSPYRWVVMPFYWGFDFTIVLAMFSVGVILPSMRQELKLSPALAGLYSSIPWVALALFMLVFSAWLSRYGPRLLIVIIAGLAASFLLLQGLADSATTLLLARAGFAIVIVARMPANTMLMQQWFPVHEMTKLNGIANTVSNVGQILAVVATPWIMAALGGWRGTFILLTCLALSAGTLWLLFGRDGPNRLKSSGPGFPLESPFAAVRKHPSLWIVASCQFGSAAAFVSFLTFWPTFGSQVRGLSLETASSLMAFFPVGSMLGSMSSNLISERLGRRRPLIWFSGFGLTICYLSILATTSGLLYVPLMLLLGYFSYVVVPIIFTFPFELRDLQPRQIAVAAGFISTITTLGGAFGPVITGLIQQGSGSLQIGMMVSCGLAVTMGILGLFMPETGRLARSRVLSERPLGGATLE